MNSPKTFGDLKERGKLPAKLKDSDLLLIYFFNLLGSLYLRQGGSVCMVLLCHLVV